MWLAIVSLVYVGGTVAMATGVGRAPGATPAASPGPGAAQDLERQSPPLQVAVGLLHGDPALAGPSGGVDTVTRDGRSYHVISFGPVAPYLAFAPVPALWDSAPWVISLAFGLLAALLAWPLASRYGPGGPATVWLATLGALGTILLPLAIQGNYYYLAHAEAMAATIVALLEWRGRRRPWVLGLCFGLAALARPTVLLAAIPFGLFTLAGSRTRIRAALAFAAPIGLVLAVMGVYNLARFGSPLESGYTVAILHNQQLIAARRVGTFSIHHVRHNLSILIAGGFRISPAFPFLVPSSYGQSILLTTPAFLLALRAGFRDRTAVLLWLSAAIVTVPLLLYYGGAGYRTYGYRYFLDVTPFLLALVAMAARHGFGRLSKGLIALSVAFCLYGVAWAVRMGHS